MPSRARLYVGRPTSDDPSNTISPFSGRSWPQTQLKSVVFPAPLGPTRPMHSPAETSKLISCTAWMPPKDLQTPRRVRRGVVSAIGARCRHGRRPVLDHPWRRPTLGEEETLEACGRTPLLILEHALGVLCVGERAEGEQHHGEAGRADARRQDGGEDLLRHEEPDPRLYGALHGGDAR